MNSKYAQMTRNLAANLPVFAHDKDHGQFTCITFIYISGFRAIGLVLNSGLFAKGGSEAASSGLEDGEEDSDSEGELDSELRPHTAVAQDSKNSEHSSRVKAYHLSPEWKQLDDVCKEKKLELNRIPPITGAGIHRHTSGAFWSMKYPGVQWKTCSWKNGVRSSLEFLIKTLRHLLKQHISTCPSDQTQWEQQCEALSTVLS